MIWDLKDILYVAVWISSCIIVGAASVVYLINWWLKK